MVYIVSRPCGSKGAVGRLLFFSLPKRRLQNITTAEQPGSGSHAGDAARLLPLHGERVFTVFAPVISFANRPRICNPTSSSGVALQPLAEVKMRQASVLSSSGQS